MFKQVRTKLTISYTLSLVIILILFIGLLYLLISHEINEKQRKDLTNYYAKEKAEMIEELYERDHHGLEYEPNRSIFYYVYNKQGEFVFGEETIQTFSNWLNQNKGIGGESFSQRITWKQRHLLFIKEPLESYGYIILGMDITSENHLIQNITWTLVVLTLMFSLLYAFLGYYFAGQAIKPIKSAFQKQEKFVSDASHELRTPLSIFYSSIDLLLKEEEKNLSNYGIEVLQDVKTEANLMSNLINSLLELARSDNNQLILDMKRVHLSDLLFSIYTRFSRKITTQIQFVQNIQNSVYLICDAIRIQQLLYILLDNALCYTKEGMITLSLKIEGNKRILLRIQVVAFHLRMLHIFLTVFIEQIYQEKREALG
ncbi:HAMP domain-containing sensor histidine kinase [Neobacillus sp. PS2-9]|uniref:sensor histidine kinase n=1 Tax=Neobacillus sp. PS2-9 TaxID=3070676 RepID=UPI0027E00521|nr:HAMP domain-containing sensor histidine kinase [Neobacillus sp. PS2-9]WML60268.1 HAMP domain-containing sensor histidine kinase [Neobacillus sp. PS2-9]